MDLPEIIKRIDSIKATIDTAFENGKLDFDQLTGELSAVGDALAERLKQELKPESNERVVRQNTALTGSQNLKIEDYTG